MEIAWSLAFMDVFVRVSDLWMNAGSKSNGFS